MEISVKSKKFGQTIVLLDEDDYLKVEKYSLSLFINRRRLYVRLSFINGKRYLLHRYLMNAPECKVVDHINHNTLDNRKENLRLCTISQNCMNSMKHYKSKTSPYKGVVFENNKYYAQIRFNKNYKRIGTYETAEEAALAYNEAALKYHGEFAYLNEVK